MNINFITQEPADEYHARSRSGEFMSSHLLADFRESPILYHKKVNGQIEEKESDAFIIGRAAHCLLLEGSEVFKQNYLVSDGPINPRTENPFGRNTKAFAEWASEQSKEVISCKDYNFIIKLQTNAWQHPAYGELIAYGAAEGVVRVDYCGVPCQIRMDWFSPMYGIVDLKTCDQLKNFENDCRRYGYIHQLAFYRAIVREVTGETVPVKIIALEKREPCSCGIWHVDEASLDYAERENENALQHFKECCSSGIWPTGYEKIRTITLI